MQHCKIYFAPYRIFVYNVKFTVYTLHKYYTLIIDAAVKGLSKFQFRDISNLIPSFNYAENLDNVGLKNDWLVINSSFISLYSVYNIADFVKFRCIKQSIYGVYFEQVVYSQLWCASAKAWKKTFIKWHLWSNSICWIYPIKEWALANN